MIVLLDLNAHIFPRPRPQTSLANELFDLVCYISFDWWLILCKILLLLFSNRPHCWCVLNIWANEMNIIHNHYAILMHRMKHHAYGVCVCVYVVSRIILSIWWFELIWSVFQPLHATIFMYMSAWCFMIWVTTNVDSIVCMHDFVLAIIHIYRMVI